MSEQVTITVDHEAVAVLVRALDVFQRIAMGQWREVVGAAPEVTGEPSYSTGFNELGDALMAARCAHTVVPELRHPNAHLSIRQAGQAAMIAHDLWRALSDTTCPGGGVRWGGYAVTDIGVAVERAAAD